ncbi:type III pantothenate kinase [Lacunimicrobium album]
MSHTVLAIDVGNIRAKFGLFEIQDHSDRTTLPNFGLTTAQSSANPINWSSVISELNLETRQDLRAVMAGSNPVAMLGIVESWPASLGPVPWQLQSRADFPFEIKVDYPDKVGTDRLLNATAVNRLKSKNSTALVIDTGTATTVDLVCTDGAFLGGAILPGFELCARALHRYTTTLPLLNVHDLFDRIPDAVGKNTHDAVCSGLYWGHVGAVNQLLTSMSATCPGDVEVYVTGGASPLLEPHLPSQTQVIPHLGLRGLVALYETVTSGQSS